MPREARRASMSERHSTNWLNTSTDCPRRDDDVDQLLERRELSRAARKWPGLVQVLRRVVADLLQHREQPEHEALAGDARPRRDGVQRLAHLGLVERRLLGRERHGQVGDGPLRKVGGDAGVGLLPAQDERADRAGEPLGRHWVAVALDGDGDGAAEPVERAEQARGGPVEDRPQLAQPVLDRGAGEGEARRRPPMVRSALAVSRLGVLRVLGLVGDDEPETGLAQAPRAPGGRRRSW